MSLRRPTHNAQNDLIDQKLGSAMKTSTHKAKRHKNGLLQSGLLQYLPARAPIALAVLAALYAPFHDAIAQQSDKDKEQRNEARGRMQDQSAPDKRAREINFVDQTPRVSERMLPNATYVLRGIERKLDEQVFEATLPGSTTPGSASSTPKFDSGEDFLTPEYTRQLDQIADSVKGRSNIRFRLTGHTDIQRLNPPTKARFGDNYGLGLARAKQVGGYLQKKLGLPDSAFTFATKGPDEPVKPQEDKANWPVNRRVVVDVFWDDVVAGKTTRDVKVNDPTVCRVLSPTANFDAGAPFRVSVDGTPVDTSQTRHVADQQRCVDVALEKGNVRIQYDNLMAAPALNLTAWPLVAKPGETIQFKGWSNYRAFIKKAEVRIFVPNAIRSYDMIATVPLNEKFEATWTTQEGMPRELAYRLRVYDEQGRWDETQTAPLSLVSERRPTKDELKPEQELLAGYGENKLDVRNIPVEGGTLTAYGDNVAKGNTVLAFGLDTPVDGKGSFVMQQIVPRIYNTAEVAVNDSAGKPVNVYRRSLALPKNDWFFVGQADLVVGRNKVTGPAALVTQDSQHYNNDTYVDGRLAFYTKRKMDGGWTFTGAVDTFYQPIEDLFKNFDYKDSRSLLRRIDPKDTWPVWGDDSTTVWDAPTQGKLYAKLEKGDSHVLWGNFRQSNTETTLSQINRGLYGLSARYVSDNATAFGERKVKAELFAADPGTASAREDFRGTGGSLYYLRNQDITRGSERVRLEIRDRDSGFVLQQRPLTNGIDYTVDFLQGRLLMTSPVPSTADDSDLVRAGSLSGNAVFLVADYEYTPIGVGSNNLAVGGRGSWWLTDNIKLGVTASKQEQTGGDQWLGAVDATYRFSEGSFVKVEAGRTKGPGVGEGYSRDGGFNFNAQPQVFNNNVRANAARIEGQMDLKDMGLRDGKVALYYQTRDAGYSAPGQLVERDTKQIGGAVMVPLGENTTASAKFDQKDETNGFDSRTLSGDVKHKFNSNWSIGVGLRHDKRTQDSFIATPSGLAAVNTINTTGERTDLGLKVEYDSNKDWSIYAFGQNTIRRTGSRLENDRLGLGGKWRINDRMTVNGEISDGDGGAGGKLGVDYQFNDRTSAYINYQVGADRTDEGLSTRNGAFVFGGRSRYSDSLTMFTEHRYAIGQLGGLTHVYGVELAPANRWTFGVTLEDGVIGRETANRLQRQAVAFKTNYTGDEMKYGGALEFRDDKSLDEKRRTILFRNNLSWKISRDARLLGRFDFSDSNSSRGDAAAADFRDFMIGYAYRPVLNDRLNLLLRFQHLYDLSAQSQLTPSGVNNDFAQKSNVLSADLTYDLTQRWTVGGKVAYRRGELRNSRDGSSPWFSSTASLVVLRADYHIVRNWDVLLEGRSLSTKDAGRRSGFLGGVYYHINENVKVGGGYNFTDFSDDITNLNYKSRGPFINILGKW